MSALDKKNIKIASRIPRLIGRIKPLAIHALLKMHRDNSKVIVLQYVGDLESDKLSDKELIDAMERSILYRELCNAQLVIHVAGDVLPEPDPRMKCIELTIGDAVKYNMLTIHDIAHMNEGYKDGIQFVACSRIGNTGRQANVGFLKPLPQNIELLA